MISVNVENKFQTIFGDSRRSLPVCYKSQKKNIYKMKKHVGMESQKSNQTR